MKSEMYPGQETLEILHRLTADVPMLAPLHFNAIKAGQVHQALTQIFFYVEALEEENRRLEKQCKAQVQVVECAQCKGSGEVMVSSTSGADFVQYVAMCGTCRGMGRVFEKKD